VRIVHGIVITIAKEAGYHNSSSFFFEAKRGSQRTVAEISSSDSVSTPLPLSS
jgi:hypothetical protein